VNPAPVEEIMGSKYWYCAYCGGMNGIIWHTCYWCGKSQKDKKS
jgi:hypothetical protein